MGKRVVGLMPLPFFRGLLGSGEMFHYHEIWQKSNFNLWLQPDLCKSHVIPFVFYAWNLGFILEIRIIHEILNSEDPIPNSHETIWETVQAMIFNPLKILVTFEFASPKLVTIIHIVGPLPSFSPRNTHPSPTKSYKACHLPTHPETYRSYIVFCILY